MPTSAASISKTKLPKHKKCRVCGSSFVAYRPLQKVCGWECSLISAGKQREKAVKADMKQRRLKLKTRSEWLKEAQHAFNSYVRARDEGKPCICCGKPMGEWTRGGSIDCGHYRSVGSAPHLRFDERNAHAQRKVCNRHGSGRAVDYRIGLITRIGLEAVESLESDQTTRKFTIDELKEIKNKYLAKTKELQKK